MRLPAPPDSGFNQIVVLDDCRPQIGIRIRMRFEGRFNRPYCCK